MWYKKLFEELEQNKNEQNKIHMEGYMRNQFPFLGIKTPLRRKIGNPYYKLQKKTTQIDWDFVFLCFQKEEREYQCIALDYLSNMKKHLTLNDLENLKKLITTKSWWDTVDYIASIVNSIIKSDNKGKEHMLKWSKDENLWVRRVSIIHQLLRKENTDTDLLEEIINNNLGSDEFFINKAIGWALRDYSKTNKEWVKNFINENKKNLSKLSIREGSKYI